MSRHRMQRRRPYTLAGFDCKVAFVVPFTCDLVHFVAVFGLQQSDDLHLGLTRNIGSDNDVGE